MKAKRKIKKYLTKGIRKVRNRRGFGVHSPFAYSLIMQVISEKSPYYAYEEILQLKKKYSPLAAILPKFVSRRMTSTKVLFLLYRLINRFAPSRILEIGNEGGLVTYVMGLPNARAEVISIGENEHKVAMSRDLFGHEKPHNCTFIETGPVSGIGLLPRHYQADFIFVHAHAARHADELFHALRKHLHEGTVLILEGIKQDPDMRRLWKYFRYSPDVRVSIDLYEVGIVIYNETLYKQHYVVSF